MSFEEKTLPIRWTSALFDRLGRNKHTGLRREAVGSIIFLGAFLVGLSSPGQDLPTMSEIAEAHNLRVAPIHSLYISWEGTKILMNGDILDNNPKTPTSYMNNGEMIVQGSSEWLRRHQDMRLDSEIVRDIVIVKVYRDGIRKEYHEFNRQGYINEDNIAKHYLVTSLLSMSFLPNPY